MSLVIDTSVAVKWFFQEEHYLAARSLLNLKKTLMAPDLIWAEFGSVVWKKMARKEVGIGTVSEIVQIFRNFPIESHSMHALLSPAVAIAQYTGATVYDSFFLALADERKSTLISADKKLCEAAKKTHIRYKHLSDI